MTDERITPEELGATLAKAISALAQAAASESVAAHARDYAEAAERLSNALAVTASMKV